jgi:hypothetical protein
MRRQPARIFVTRPQQRASTPAVGLRGCTSPSARRGAAEAAPSRRTSRWHHGVFPRFEIFRIIQSSTASIHSCKEEGQRITPGERRRTPSTNSINLVRGLGRELARPARPRAGVTNRPRGVFVFLCLWAPFERWSGADCGARDRDVEPKEAADEGGEANRGSLALLST